MITGAKPQPQSQEANTAAVSANRLELTNSELGVLKKLDTLRYNERTRESVKKLLNDEENRTLQDLLKRKIVTLFKKKNDKELD